MKQIEQDSYRQSFQFCRGTIFLCKESSSVQSLVNQMKNVQTACRKSKALGACVDSKEYKCYFSVYLKRVMVQGSQSLSKGTEQNNTVWKLKHIVGKDEKKWVNPNHVFFRKCLTMKCKGCHIVTVNDIFSVVFHSRFDSFLFLNAELPFLRHSILVLTCFILSPFFSILVLTELEF